MSEMLDIEKFKQDLQSLSIEDWQPLFELIDEIKKTSAYGELKGGNKISKGFYQMPYYDSSEIVLKFMDYCYNINIVSKTFDWMNWKEGSKYLNDIETDYSVFDTVTLCHFITAMIRNDRFCDGYLISCFRKGIVIKILLALKNNIKNRIY